jgi:uncharacterized membrane protein
MGCRSLWYVGPCSRCRLPILSFPTVLSNQLSLAVVVASSAPTPPQSISWPLRTRFGDVVFTLFMCAQVIDGTFTYLGIESFGWTEGNPLIAWYMHHFGVAPIVMASKLLAIGCAVVLHVLGFHRMLALLTLIYLSVAILPWAFVLFVLH